MSCINDIMSVIPERISSAIVAVANRYRIKELRLRVGKPVILRSDKGEILVDSEGRESVASKALTITEKEIREVIDRVSRFSVYAFSEDLKRGYITISGGHRVGVCGHVVTEDNHIVSMRNISSVNIRFAHSVIGCSGKIMRYIYHGDGINNTLIISPPGCGKTTLLRDIAVCLSDGDEQHGGLNVGICDERSEIAACKEGIPQNYVGLRTDVLDACPKALGMTMLLRSMNPDVIAVDELGGLQDLDAVLMLNNCGCAIVATVHGENIEEIFEKKCFELLFENKTFKRYIVLRDGNEPGVIAGVYDERGREI